MKLTKKDVKKLKNKMWQIDTNKPEIKNELQQMSGGMKKRWKTERKETRGTVDDSTHEETV